MPRLPDDSMEPSDEPTETAALSLLFYLCELMRFLKQYTDIDIPLAERIIIDLNIFFLVDQNKTLNFIDTKTLKKKNVKLSARHLNQKCICCFL